MRYLAIIRSVCMMILGVVVYGILLWGFGRKIPGSPRRHKGRLGIGYDRLKVWIVLGYHFILAFLILLCFLLIKYLIRGDL